MLRSLKTLLLILLVLPTTLLASCSDDDEARALPSFGEISFSPAKAEYQVGDQIVCTIKMTKPAGSDLRDASYWWYTSEWFSDLSIDPDFCEANEEGEFVSQPITLTHAGDWTIYFFGRVEFPHYDWKKVELGKTIKVKE